MANPYGATLRMTADLLEAAAENLEPADVTVYTSGREDVMLIFHGASAFEDLVAWSDWLRGSEPAFSVFADREFCEARAEWRGLTLRLTSNRAVEAEVWQ